jgi:hypothetical protein
MKLGCVQQVTSYSTSPALLALDRERGWMCKKVTPVAPPSSLRLGVLRESDFRPAKVK